MYDGNEDYIALDRILRGLRIICMQHCVWFFTRKVFRSLERKIGTNIEALV